MPFFTYALSKSCLKTANANISRPGMLAYCLHTKYKYGLIQALFEFALIKIHCLMLHRLKNLLSKGARHA